MIRFYIKVVGVLFGTAVTFALAGAYNSTTSVQRGNPGLGMDLIEKNDVLIARSKANVAPPALPPASQDGQLAVDAYKNVQVLGHITSGEMTRLMTAMTLWVAPKEGCVYCHAPQRDAAGNIVTDASGAPQADPNNLHSDEQYTKRVARRMLQMTMHINSKWSSHVKETGVTCYTCHRGNPVPTQIWFDEPENPQAARALGDNAGQNAPSTVAGLSSLPSGVFRPFLASDEGVRVISTEPLPIDNRLSIKQTEYTYGLMMHISTALGVNCTHCHNTRSMADWSTSPLVRAQAWYGIRMARDLNTTYLEPLAATFPKNRLGPTGDAPKVNCATCHQGAYKPLLGAPMLAGYRVLAEAKPQPAKSPPPPPPVAPAPPVEAGSGSVPPAAAMPGATAPAAASTPAVSPPQGSAGTPSPAPSASVPAVPAKNGTPAASTAPSPH